MVDSEAFPYFVRQMGFVDKGEIVELVPVSPEHDNAHVWMNHAQYQAYDEPEVSVAPHSHGIASFVRYGVESAHRVHGDAD